MRVLISATCFAIFAASVPCNALAEEPTVAVPVDSDAFDRATTLFACLQDFKRRHREERSNPANLDRLNQQERGECRVEESQKAILDRLRVVYPELTESQLGQKYQEVVLLAAFSRPKGTTPTAKTPNAPNR